MRDHDPMAEEAERAGASGVIHTLVLVAVLVAIAIAMASCDWPGSTGPTQSTTVIVTQQGAAGTGTAPGAPGAAPGPAPGAAVRLTVDLFAIACAGKESSTLRQGCVGRLTASPFDASGTDVGQPSDSVSWSVSGCAEPAGIEEANRHNYNIRGTCVGAFRATATLANGVSGSLDGTVMQ